MRSATSASLAAALILAVLLCTACNGTRPDEVLPQVVARQVLPLVPDRYRLCFAGVVGLPAGAWSASQTAAAVSAVRASELEKTDCGRDFIEWYEGVRRDYGAPQE